jgi:hypothetical protein
VVSDDPVRTRLANMVEAARRKQRTEATFTVLV